jgi:phenylacetate-coenzyme A ligase PaaK-like adenylate-forming protein
VAPARAACHSCAVTETIARARGTLTILRELRDQRRLPFLPRERIHELRDARTRAMIRFAAEHVPYYRDLFRSEGIDPRELRGADDLRRLPLLDKRMVLEDPARFRSPAVARGDGLWVHSNGSRSNLRFGVFHDRRSLLQTIAHGERDRAVESALCGKRVRYTAVEIRDPTATLWKVQRFYERASYRPLRPKRLSIALSEPVDRVVELLNELRPDVVRSHGSYLAAFFRLVEERGLELRAPNAVVYAGDAMPPAARRFVEERFGTAVLSRYGAVEALKIGFTCEERDGFHLCEDLCHLEVVDAQGNRLGSGALGETVISNLVNRGTVLLNYRLEDLVRVTDAPCPCGRTAPRVTEIEGRAADVVYLPNGDLVHQFTIWCAIESLRGLSQYQVAQTDPTRFELRLVVSEADAYERVAREAAGRVRTVLRGLEVQPVRVERLEQDGSGKIRTLISLPPRGVPD